MGKLNDEKSASSFFVSASCEILSESLAQQRDRNVSLIPIVRIVKIKIVVPLGTEAYWTLLLLRDGEELYTHFDPLPKGSKTIFALSPISDALKVESKLNQVTFCRKGNFGLFP